MTGGPYFTHPPPFIPLPNELDPRRAAFSQSRSPHAAGISIQEVAVAFRTGPAVGVGEEPRRGGGGASERLPIPHQAVLSPAVTAQPASVAVETAGWRGRERAAEQAESFRDWNFPGSGGKHAWV